jgi:hypothetical protein
MKLPLLALLCAGTAAFCQSPPSGRVDSDHLFQMPDKFSQTGPDFTKLPSNFAAITTPLAHIVVIPPMRHPQIDPEMIIRPPHSDRDVQPQGQNVSRNLYPSLRFLPVCRGRQ